MLQNRPQGETSSIQLITTNPAVLRPLFQKHLFESINLQNLDPFEMQFKKINKMIYMIIRQYPLATKPLFPIMRQLFPHSDANIRIQKRYFNYGFFFCRYVPAFQEQFFTLLFDKLEEMDVCYCFSENV